ncbi:site-specific integrase [Rummeliibacillus sp. SL167]|uniref:site-specific integrase n=1 Tax=Rummeliibacillus sp. SL167 TaxID=2579792 RepID=UPI0011B41755|nr:site-specific integrase [Rummeliibacillus sp. SL167]
MAQFLLAKYKCVEALKNEPLDFRVPVYLGLSLGLRRGEIFGLTWDRVDFKAKTITIDRQLIHPKDGLTKPKTNNSNRILPIPDILLDLLKKHRASQTVISPLNLVNSNEHGGYASPNYFTKKFKRFLQENDLPIIRFHDTRHSNASISLASGNPFKSCLRIARTLIYNHYSRYIWPCNRGYKKRCGK